jgi:hypothetical protein
MKKLLVFLIPLVVVAALLGVAFYFRLYEKYMPGIADSEEIREMPKVNMVAGKKPVTGFGKTGTSSASGAISSGSSKINPSLVPASKPAGQSGATVETDDTSSIENDLNGISQQF